MTILAVCREWRKIMICREGRERGGGPVPPYGKLDPRIILLPEGESEPRRLRLSYGNPDSISLLLPYGKPDAGIPVLVYGRPDRRNLPLAEGKHEPSSLHFPYGKPDPRRFPLVLGKVSLRRLPIHMENLTITSHAIWRPGLIRLPIPYHMENQTKVNLPPYGKPDPTAMLPFISHRNPIQVHLKKELYSSKLAAKVLKVYVSLPTFIVLL
jgi:hypothetical protein